MKRGFNEKGGAAGAWELWELQTLESDAQSIPELAALFKDERMANFVGELRDASSPDSVARVILDALRFALLVGESAEGALGDLKNWHKGYLRLRDALLFSLGAL